MDGKNLDTPPGSQPASVKTFSCPSCGASVVIRAMGQSVTAVCGSCSTIIDATNENYKIIEKASKKSRRDQVIALGQRGKINGALWEVIGYVERTDESGLYCWSEYLIFNPMKGFRWLTEFDGHWNYIITTKEKPVKSVTSSFSGQGREYAEYLGKRYYLFNKGSAKVTYVMGEFYWLVKVGETVTATDYISPPEMLSCEESKNEVIWSIGQYVEADSIKAAFQISADMPLQTGVAPNQPSTVTEAATYTGKYWGIFIGIILAVQILFLMFAKNETVYTGSFDYSSFTSLPLTTPTPGSPLENVSANEKMKVSPQFELKYGLTNVAVDLYSNVSNSWMEVQGDLVNDDNGDTEEFEEGVEYYSGYDSDGSWTEGDRTHDIIVSSIPAGRYHLNLEATGPIPSSGTYTLTVRRDAVTWSNFLWAISLISLYPLFVHWRNRSFEMNRWSQSDFSPYYSQSDSDDELEIY